MIVYRLSRKKSKDKLSGYGASLNAQRWNSKGTEVIYVAQSRALANSEVAVHLALGILPHDYFMVRIEIPNSVEIRELTDLELPRGWNSMPYRPVAQFVGDEFVRQNRHLALKIPSAVVKDDFNFILNLKHSDFKKVRIIGSEPFPFDPRYFGR